MCAGDYPIVHGSLPVKLNTYDGIILSEDTNDLGYGITVAGTTVCTDIQSIYSDTDCVERPFHTPYWIGLF